MSLFSDLLVAKRQTTALELDSPKFDVIDSMSFGFRFRGLPFCRGGCGRPCIPCGGVDPKKPALPGPPPPPPAMPTFILIPSFGLGGPLGDAPNCEYWQDIDNGVGAVVGGSKVIS